MSDDLPGLAQATARAALALKAAYRHPHTVHGLWKAHTYYVRPCWDAEPDDLGFERCDEDDEGAQARTEWVQPGPIEITRFVVANLVEQGWRPPGSNDTRAPDDAAGPEGDGGKAMKS